MLEQIETVLNERVRPQLLLHGGGIRSLGVEDGIYRFSLVGQCANCPSAYLETQEMVREAVLQAVPELQDAQLVQQVSEDLLAQARAILHRRAGDSSHD